MNVSTPSHLPFRPLSTRASIAWGLGAVASFHLAYELCPPLILIFLLCLYRLAHAARRPQAMYRGWLVGLLIYAPQLGFFYRIFGLGALALWLVLATWLSVCLVLQRFALLKLGPQFGAWAAPFLWTGVEYFRSELYYLRFTWLNAGYTFSSFPQHALLGWIGMYGIGFILMGLAALCPFGPAASRRRQWGWTIALGAFLAAVASVGDQRSSADPPPARPLKVAGVQFEFAEEGVILAALDKLLGQVPDADLFMLSEYSFDGPIPTRVKQWCAQHRKYLVAGGKDYLDPAEKEFRNTAFVIDPEGRILFKQVKAVPIQFFKDGVAAAEQKVWDSPWGKIGICVCYDLSYTRVTDELIRQGAQAILVPTMDVEEWGAHQHRLHARVAPVRAAEYGVPIFRLCSSGISQAVNRQGGVMATAPFPGQGHFITATISMAKQGSRPIDRILVWPCVAVSLGLLGWHLLDSFRPAGRR